MSQFKLSPSDFDDRLVALIDAYEAARTAAYRAQDPDRNTAEVAHRAARVALGQALIEVTTFRRGEFQYVARRSGAKIEVERIRVAPPGRHTNLPAPGERRKKKVQAKVETKTE